MTLFFSVLPPRFRQVLVIFQHIHRSRGAMVAAGTRLSAFTNRLFGVRTKYVFDTTNAISELPILGAEPCLLHILHVLSVLDCRYILPSVSLSD